MHNACRNKILHRDTKRKVNSLITGVVPMRKNRLAGFIFLSTSLILLCLVQVASGSGGPFSTVSNSISALYVIIPFSDQYSNVSLFPNFYRDIFLWSFSISSLANSSSRNWKRKKLTAIRFLLNASDVRFDAWLVFCEEHWPVFGFTLVPDAWRSLIRLTMSPINRSK